MRSLSIILIVALSLSGAAERVQSTAHLNVRSGPGTGFGKLWVAKPGTSFPTLGRDGHWLKVRLVQYREGRGVGYFMDSSAVEAAPGDSVTVQLLSGRGLVLKELLLPRAQLEMANATPAAFQARALRQVHIFRIGWVNAGFTRGPSTNAVSTDRAASLRLPVPAQAEPTPVLNWGWVHAPSSVFLPMKGLKEVGRLDSGTVVQILSEEKGFLKVQVSSTDLRDTLFVDLNQYYDLNSGDTTTLVAGGRTSVQALGSIRKDQVRFDANRAFFGPGISRLVPVETDLPLLLKNNTVSRFKSVSELGAALKTRKETHPRQFFTSEVAGRLVQLTREDLESVISPRWFIQGTQDSLALGLTLKTVAVRETGRNPEEYFFQKYVRRVLEACHPSASALKEISELIVEVEYMEPGSRGEAVLFRTMTYRVPAAAVELLEEGQITYHDLYRQASISRGNS